MTATCRSCHAPVAWVTTKDGRPMPLDPRPHPDGNVVLLPESKPGEFVVRVLSRKELPAQVPAFRSHFATCPG